MGVWSDGSGWCLCAGGGRSERVKGSIFSSKGAALAAISVSSGSGGSGFMIHRNLLLTTHTNIPSTAAAEAAETRLAHGRLTAKLVPHRFFITSSVLDLTIVGLDTVECDLAPQRQQPHYLRTCCKPSLDLRSTVYLLGHADKKGVMIGEGKVTIATDNLIKLSTDGVIWCPGSAGFDVQGNLAFMVCDPMKLAPSPATRSSLAASSSSQSWKKHIPMQFGIPIPVICDWLYQHWQGSLDEVSKPKLPLIRLISGGQRSDHSCPSFALRRLFKPAEENGSRTKLRHRSSSSANAKISHDENPLVDLHSTGEQGIPTSEIRESLGLTSGLVRRLDIDSVPRVPKTIFLPLPLQQMLCDEANAEGSRARNLLRDDGSASEATWRQQQSSSEAEDCCSDVQSTCSPAKISELGSEGNGISTGEETMYSAETMESRNIMGPKESKLQQVGRSQSCVNYTGWTSLRSSAGPEAAVQKQHSPIPARTTHSQAVSLPQRISHDYLSPTMSSSMKKGNSFEQQRARPHRIAVRASPGRI